MRACVQACTRRPCTSLCKCSHESLYVQLVQSCTCERCVAMRVYERRLSRCGRASWCAPPLPLSQASPISVAPRRCSRKECRARAQRCGARRGSERRSNENESEGENRRGRGTASECERARETKRGGAERVWRLRVQRGAERLERDQGAFRARVESAEQHARRGAHHAKGWAACVHSPPPSLSSSMPLLLLPLL